MDTNDIHHSPYDAAPIETPHANEPVASYQSSARMNRTVFTPAQLELLDAMASVKSADELLALKHAISEFFARRADEEMERLWQSGEWNEQTLQDLRNTHYRTPYKE